MSESGCRSCLRWSSICEVLAIAAPTNARHGAPGRAGPGRRQAGRLSHRNGLCHRGQRLERQCGRAFAASWPPRRRGRSPCWRSKAPTRRWTMCPICARWASGWHGAAGPARSRWWCATSIPRACSAIGSGGAAGRGASGERGAARAGPPGGARRAALAGRSGRAGQRTAAGSGGSRHGPGSGRGLGDSVHLVLDDGRSRFGQPSSVVRVSDGTVRSGAVGRRFRANASSGWPA